MSANIVRLKGPVVSNYLIYDRDSTVLIDGGFWRGKQRLVHALSQIGRKLRDLDLILLTHGHLDHTLHLADIRARSGAPVAGHPADQVHINGRWPYRGPSRFAGFF